MRMAGCIRACRLVLDGSNNPQHAGPVRIAVDPEPVGTIQPRQRLGLGMAAVTGFGALIDNMILLQRIGGGSDPSVLVEYADPLHAWLRGYGQDGVVHPLPIVAQHVIGGAALDGITDAFRA